MTIIVLRSTTIDGVPTLVLRIDNFQLEDEQTFVCRTKNIAGIDAGIVALRAGLYALIATCSTCFSQS